MVGEDEESSPVAESGASGPGTGTGRNSDVSFACSPSLPSGDSASDPSAPPVDDSACPDDSDVGRNPDAEMAIAAPDEPAQDADTASAAAAAATCDVEEARPEEAADDLPPGWKMAPSRRGFKGEGDKIFISPSLKLRFRARLRMEEFVVVISEEGGNEERAWEKYKQRYGNRIRSYVHGQVFKPQHVVALTRPARSHATIVSHSNDDAPGVRVKKSSASSIAKDNDATEEEDGHDYWEVEMILDRRKRNSRHEYLVRWKGCSEEQDTWEPLRNLSHEAQEEVKEKFGKKRKVAPHKKKSKKKKKRKLNPVIPFQESPFVDAPPPAEVNGGTVEGYIMATRKTAPETNFLSIWANNRVIFCQYDLSRDLSGFNPQKTFTDLGGQTYCLVAQKIHEPASRAKMQTKKSLASLYYLAKSGRRSLQSELEKIADFASLPPHKIVSRLELFLSPTKQVWHLEESDFEMIEEHNNEGCGFISPKLFDELFGMSRPSKRKDSFQVRIFGPCVGIAKGMLIKKIGITKIQLPPSMIKVPPSKVSDGGTWVSLIATSAQPSRSSEYLGRKLDPDAKDPPKASMDPSKWRLREMYQRLIVGLGVPKNVIQRYHRGIKRNPGGIQHAHLRGVCDPTGGLIPADCIFIPGFVKDIGDDNMRRMFCSVHKEVFVTRSPCMEPSDAKIIKVLSLRPEAMPQESWDFLCNLRFGHIVFPTAGDSASNPLCFQVGEGDLDGDDYLVVWNEDIIEPLKQASHSCLEQKFHQKESSEKETIRFFFVPAKEFIRGHFRDTVSASASSTLAAAEGGGACAGAAGSMSSSLNRASSGDAGDAYAGTCTNQPGTEALPSRTSLMPEIKVPECGTEAALVEEDVGSKPTSGEPSSWLEAAQEEMLDLSKLKSSSMLIGRLYGLCKKTAAESRAGIFSKDACSFGRAYKDSIDSVKHGNKVRLPGHLHNKLPENLRQHLEDA